MIAGDVGALVYLCDAVYARACRTSGAGADTQQEGEWTVVWLTVAAGVCSFAAIIAAFSDAAIMPPASKEFHIALAAVALLLSWLMTQTTFAFR